MESFYKTQTIENFKVFFFKQVKSTSITSTEEYFSQLNDNIVIIADAQTDGVGRQQTVWQSLKGNLFATIVLDLKQYLPSLKQLHKLPEISFVMALALCGAIEDIDDFNNSKQNKISIKWPNDILLNDAKLAGVLLEVRGDKMHIGIGINVCKSPTIDNYKTISLKCAQIETNSFAVLTNILKFTNLWLYRWQNDGFESILLLWKSKLAQMGNKISVKTPNGTHKGIFSAIDDEGGLILTLEDNSKKIFKAGVVMFDST